MEAHVVAQSVAGRPPARGRAARLVPSLRVERDIWLYTQSGLVYGQAFDPKTFQTQGDAFPILERITNGPSINGGSLILAISRPAPSRMFRASIGRPTSCFSIAVARSAS
jgi:hypothetical protein